MIRNRDYRDLAVFTIVQDEPEFIHPWINHYKRHLADSGDIYVLVHAPTYPDNAEIPPNAAWRKADELMRRHHHVVTLPVHHASAFDHRWLVQAVATFQSFLLQSYEWVLFAEIDEFVIPTPHPAQPRGTLLDYVRSLGSAPPPAVRASGFEVVQQPNEPPLPPELYADGSNAALSARELLAARRWWYPSRIYSKTLLANTPLRWSRGFHEAQGLLQPISHAPPAQELTLLHFHRVDFDLALGRLRRSRARRWSQSDIANRLGWQNRVGEEQFRQFWSMDSDTEKPLAPGRLALIPPAVHDALDCEPP